MCCVSTVGLVLTARFEVCVCKFHRYLIYCIGHNAFLFDTSFDFIVVFQYYLIMMKSLVSYCPRFSFIFCTVYMSL